MIALSDAELFEVTRRRQSSAQVRVLRAMGIAHRIRPDGSVLVLRQSLLDEAPMPTVQESEINWN